MFTTKEVCFIITIFFYLGKDDQISFEHQNILSKHEFEGL